MNNNDKNHAIGVPSQQTAQGIGLPIDLDTICYLSDEDLKHLPFDDILCPVLRIGIRAGLLQLDLHGCVNKKELNIYMEQIGLHSNSTILKAVIDAAHKIKRDDAQPEKLSLIALKGSNVFDHGSVSGILRYEVDRQSSAYFFSRKALDKLKQHSKDKENLDLNDLAAATNKFHECPFKKVKTSVFGVFAATFEYALLLDLFGNRSENNNKYFSLDDIENIWAKNKFPKYWTPPRKPYFGSIRFMRLTLIHGWKKLDHKVKEYIISLFSEEEKSSDATHEE